MELGKSNRQLSADVEMWRRKCGVIQEKYQSMRNIFNKDKFIGRKKDDEIASGAKDRKLNQSVNSKSAVTLEEVNNLLENFNVNQSVRLKNKVTYEEMSDPGEKIEIEGKEADYSKNRWDCLGKIETNSGPVLSLATHANMLISTGTKSLKIWDLETSKVISDLSGPHLSGFVKFVAVNPEMRVMVTACDKIVTIWDLITLNVEGQLKAHKDEVRTMHMVGDYLFSAGKGGTNSGSLLAWDFRNLNPNCPLE